MQFARPFSLFDRLPGPPFSNDGPVFAVYPAGAKFVAQQPAASACQRRHARNGEKRGTAPDTGGLSRRSQIRRVAASRFGMSAAARSEWGEAGNRSRYRRFIPPVPNLSRGSQPRRLVSGDTPRRYFTLAAVLSLRTTSWAPPSMMLVAETRVSFAFS